MPAKGGSSMAVERVSDATGAILAGGAGKRLGGVQKAFIEIDGEPIIARTLRLFRSLFAETILIANDAAPYDGLGVPVIGDEIPGKGAPGGLHAALGAASTGWVFLVACDMPLVREALVRAMATRRREGDAVLCRADDRLQTTCAFYGPACRPALDTLLRTGDPSFRDMLAGLRIAELPEAELSAIDPDHASFRNINTPEDLAALGARLPSR